MGWVIAWVGLSACTGSPPEPALTLDGPDQVRVDHLGPVPSPRVLQADGTEPSELAWTAADPSIASVVDGAVVAVGAGSTEVVGQSGDDSVRYTLTVVPAVVLRFADP